MKKMVYFILNLLPEAIFQNVRNKYNEKLKYRMDNIWFYRIKKRWNEYMRRIASSSDLSECVIRKGTYSYRMVNGCFIDNMLSLCVYSIAKGFIPRMEVLDENGVNLWELYFRPIMPRVNKMVECDVNSFWYFEPHWDCIFNRREKRFWCQVYSELVHFNEEMRQYTLFDFRNTIGDKKNVLGVLCRGTDYIRKKPKGHPRQPSMEELVSKVREEVDCHEYQYVYLATEEKRISDFFHNEFPGKILENKRVYFDDEYYGNELQYIAEIKMDYESRMREYLSSIYILSKCDALVAGNCGGTKQAILMNNLEYKKVFVFDLGVYE